MFHRVLSGTRTASWARWLSCHYFHIFLKKKIYWVYYFYKQFLGEASWKLMFPNVINKCTLMFSVWSVWGRWIRHCWQECKLTTFLEGNLAVSINISNALALTNHFTLIYHRDILTHAQRHMESFIDCHNVCISKKLEVTQEPINRILVT